MINTVPRSFPAWHFSMLNDRVRNSLIESAIRESGVEGKTVFEIGSGAGLTAMIFARYGARAIITCEIDTQLYQIAQKIFSTNGLSDRITIFNKSSRELIRDGDLPFTPDLIFTETLDCGIVGEGFSSIKEDIEAVSGPNTIVLPFDIVQYGYLIESSAIYDLNHVTSYADFDLTPLNIYSTKSYYPVRASLHSLKELTPVFLMRTFSYTKSTSLIGHVTTEAHVEGVCHGIISFFEASFGRYIVSNDVRTFGHWHQAFHPLREPMRVQSGRFYKINFALNGTSHLEEMRYEQA